MESPGGFPESPLDGDESNFPCKGCGEILEEGKAFELGKPFPPNTPETVALLDLGEYNADNTDKKTAGNRWHIDCFRCNTCSTLLDSDANLLLLGDGSLICNNCTYSCNACGNKIEDLAILTGDQAFCATCFKCRNCKRKIENLRYARTSQGIFCMSCHESLMARRRKKTRAAAAQQKASNNASAQSPMLLDKSLPSIPHGSREPVEEGSPLSESNGDTPTELSPHPASLPPRKERKKRDRSPLHVPNPYSNNRHSFISQNSDLSGAGPDTSDSFSIPMLLDTGPAPGSSTSKMSVPTEAESGEDDRGRERDYLASTRTSSRPGRREPHAGLEDSPHIAYQERGRKSSKDSDVPYSKSRGRHDADPSTNTSTTKGPSPINGVDDTRIQHAHSQSSSHGGRLVTAQGDDFKLQEVPRSKKLASNRSSTYQTPPPSEHETPSPGSSRTARPKETLTSSLSDSAVPLLPSSRPKDASRQDKGTKDESYSSLPTRKPLPRTDSLNAPKAGSSHDLSLNRDTPSSLAAESHSDRSGSSQSMKITSKASDSSSVSSHGGVTPELNGPDTRPAKEMHDGSSITSTIPSRLPPPHDMSPRSISTTHTEPSPRDDAVSPDALPRYNTGGDFSMEEDMARILGENDEGSNSILRRVSNAVRHGRSFSDMESRPRAPAPKWPGSPNGQSHGQYGGHAVASPEAIALKQELRKSQQKIAELEAQVTGTADIKSLDTRLREKRSTVAFLDSQKEVVVRELEILTDKMAEAKNSRRPLDVEQLKNSVVKELYMALEQLKESYRPQIQELMDEKNSLVQECETLERTREQTIKETEQLNIKNAQLADLNNELTHQIQQRYQANKQQTANLESPRHLSNGLGIYSHTHKDRSDLSMDSVRESSRPNINHSGSMSSIGPVSTEPTDVQPARVLQAPHVVNIGKGQVKKFNWKKGGQTVAKGVSKGFKGAFSSTDQKPYGRDGQPIDGSNYREFTESPGSSGSLARPPPDPARQGLNFFGNRLGKGVPGKMPSNGNLQNYPQEAASTLFGSELSDRADFERRQIPNVVTRCIEEVELRGMDVEGIYRKTGGNSQVKAIQEGFERSEDYDISDPGLDITAVTSVLKQYFRRLPTPLLTYDVYDSMLATNSIVEDEERIHSMRNTIHRLPTRHRECLEFLIFHLARVTLREKENLMTPKNLAVVFAPTIMRDTSLEREMSDMHAKNTAIQFLIEHNKSIFAGI